MQIEDNLHEIWNHAFWEKYEKSFNMSSAENYFTRMANL